MINIRKAEDRGHADHGWLDTRHTFSFSSYRDERYMGFRSLRVINEDRVQPGKGFDTHPHQDMEIISYVLEGALAHRDSTGTGSVIRPGDVQRMSAGTGVMHSEFNDSSEEPVHFLQIWLLPDKKGVKPSYEQKTFSREDKLGKLRLIASPDGREGSVSINQDAYVYASVLVKDSSLPVPIAKNRHLWVQAARGKIKLNDVVLSAGDGAAVSDETSVNLSAVDEAEILIFDLA
jgi:redox-sensitive bicupin YhaK (pirin superfamily)